jgi:hypothetical protein
MNNVLISSQYEPMNRWVGQGYSRAVTRHTRVRPTWGEGAGLTLACMGSLFDKTLGNITEGAPGGAVGPRVLPA